MSGYNKKVLIGNWNEDKALSEIRKKSVQHKARLGERLIDQVRAANVAGSLPAQISYHEDGLLRYGDFIALKHCATEKYFAGNLSVEKEPRAYQASGVNEQSLRTSFMIQPAPGSSQKEFVELGDEVLLLTAPALRTSAATGLCQKQLYVMSAPASVLGSTSRSGEQEVRVTCEPVAKKDLSNMRWRIEELQAQPSPLGADLRISSGHPIQFIHCASGKSLAMDASSVVYNDYGPELDAFCCLHKPTRRVHVLKREARGTHIADQRVPVLERNEWIVELAETPDYENTYDSCQELSSDAVFDYIASIVSATPSEFEDHVRSYDKAHDDMLDRVEFKYALLDAGLDLSPDEIAIISDFLSIAPGKNANAIPITGFLSYVLNPESKS